jgi:hypothetical protein
MDYAANVRPARCSCRYIIILTEAVRAMRVLHSGPCGQPDTYVQGGKVKIVKFARNYLHADDFCLCIRMRNFAPMYGKVDLKCSTVVDGT